VDENELDDEETEDLVELTADGVIEEPRSELGRYPRAPLGATVARRRESLVYWLRKLVFRGAWLDHRVKDGRLDVTWDEARRSSRISSRAATARCWSSPRRPPGTSCSSAELDFTLT
jgi:hypothetical protein